MISKQSEHTRRLRFFSRHRVYPFIERGTIYGNFVDVDFLLKNIFFFKCHNSETVLLCPPIAL